MKLITYSPMIKEKQTMISLVTQLLKAAADFKVLVDLIVPLSLTFLRIFLATLVEGLQEEQVTEEMI